MKSLILYFFLLVLKISLNFDLNAGYKQDRFYKILLKKDLEFSLSKGGGTIAFDLSLMLLSAKINLVAEEQSCKKNMFKTCN